MRQTICVRPYPSDRASTLTATKLVSMWCRVAHCCARACSEARANARSLGRDTWLAAVPLRSRRLCRLARAGALHVCGRHQGQRDPGGEGVPHLQLRVHGGHPAPVRTPGVQTRGGPSGCPRLCWMMTQGRQRPVLGAPTDRGSVSPEECRTPVHAASAESSRAGIQGGVPGVRLQS